jgi:outer membrane biogenesis lipoprotein LolB
MKQTDQGELMKHARRAALFALAPAVLTACSTDPREAIVGQWKKGAERAEFTESGDFFLSNGQKGVRGRYEFLDHSRIRVSMDGPFGMVIPQEYRVAVDGDELSVCEGEDTVGCMEFTRAD